MLDERDLRQAYLVSKEGDTDTSLNKKISIKIIGLLPIVGGNHMDRLTGVDGIDFGKTDEIVNTTPSIDADFNVLFDKEDGMESRFSFIGTAKSVATKLKVSLFYDDKYKDIIIVPDLDTFGTGANLDFHTNNSVAVEGYSVGSAEKLKKSTSELLLTVDKDDTDSIPKPKRLASITTILAPVYGLEKNSLFTGNAMKMPDVANYSKRGAPLQFIVLGTNAEVFDTETKVNTYNLTQVKAHEMRLDFVNKRAIGKIVIPINF